MRPLLRLSALLLILPLAFPISAFAATQAKPYHYNRLFYYVPSAAAKKSFFAHPGPIDIFAPQTYSLNPDGTLSGSLDADLIAFAKKEKIPVMPLVTNDNFSDESYQGILGDPVKEETAIRALMTEAKDKGYWGWQFDFEQMHAEYRDQYSAFIAKAAQEFHAARLKLSVAVIAKVSDDAGDYKGSLYQNLIGVYDYDALSQSSDFISLMSYDDPESKGPVVEYPWLVRVLTYARAHIPAKKLSLGIPLYYWQWNDVTGKLVEIGGNKSIDTIIKKQKDEKFYYDPTEQAPSMYFVEDGVPYTIWYENGRSVAAKIALVKKYKLYGVSFWALGLETPSIYSAIKQ